MFTHTNLVNVVIAVGGQDGVSCLNIVERYDPKTNRWTKLAGMQTRRLGVAVAVLGGYLYAIGGLVRYFYFQSLILFL